MSNYSDFTPISELTPDELSNVLIPLKSSGKKFEFVGNYIEVELYGSLKKRLYHMGEIVDFVCLEKSKRHEPESTASSRKNLNSTTDQLEAENKRLREKGRLALAERDRWRNEANQLSELISSLKVNSDDTLDQLKAENKRLREKGRLALAERDRWRSEANQLSELISTLEKNQCNINGKEDHRFTKLKREFAKLYHPNNSTGKGSMEQIIRTEFFKEFWAVIEGIEDT